MKTIEQKVLEEEKPVRPKKAGVLAKLRRYSTDFRAQLAVCAGLGMGCVSEEPDQETYQQPVIEGSILQIEDMQEMEPEVTKTRMTLEQAYMMFITNLLRQNNPLIVDFDRLDEPVEEAAQANPSSEAVNEEEAVEGGEGPRYRFDVIPYETLSLPPVEVPEMTLVGRDKEVKDRYLEEYGAIEYTLAMLNDIYDLPEAEIERIRAVFLGFKNRAIEINNTLENLEREPLEQFLTRPFYNFSERVRYGFQENYGFELSSEALRQDFAHTIAQLNDESLMAVVKCFVLQALFDEYGAAQDPERSNTPLDFFREEDPTYDCNVVSSIRYILAWELGIREILMCYGPSITNIPGGHVWLTIPLQKKDGTTFYWHQDNILLSVGESFQQVIGERYQNMFSVSSVYSNFDEALIGGMQVEINNYNYELVFRETSDGRSLLDYLPHLDVRESYFICQKALALYTTSIDSEVYEGFIIHAFLSAVYVLRNEAISRRLYEKLTPFIKEAMVNKLGGTRYLPQEGE